MKLKRLLRILPVATLITIATMVASHRLGVPHGIDAAVSGFLISFLIVPIYARDHSEATA